jgi:hypothetical protein
VSTGCSHAEVAAFIEQFEAQRLPKAQWTHAGHLVAGFWYVRRLGADRALAELRTGIRCHNESVGTANTDSSGYHETITRLYVEAIAAYLHRMPAQSFEDALRGLLASPLSSSDWPLLFYTKARLFSAQARRQWLAPDLTDQEQGA